MVEKTDVSRQYFWPVQKFIVLELGLTLIPVTSQKEAANMLAALVCIVDYLLWISNMLIVN